MKEVACVISVVAIGLDSPAKFSIYLLKLQKHSTLPERQEANFLIFSFRDIISASSLPINSFCGLNASSISPMVYRGVICC